MWFLYVVGGIAILIAIYYYIILPIQRKKIVKEKLSQFFVFNEYKGKNYNYTIEKENTILYIKLLCIPHNSTVTINSKDTWQLSWGGSTAKPGRVYPRQKYLDEMKPFLRQNILKENNDENKKVRKVILIYKKTEKVLRYLNESELDIVSVSDSPYGYKVAQFAKIDEEIDKLFL